MNRDSESVDSEDSSWIEWFCNQKGNRFFCQVPMEWIEDSFNLYGLKGIVPYYSEALQIIRDGDLEDDRDDELYDVVEASAEFLYGMIHARYILTPDGLDLMREKYEKRDFGRCLRVLCKGQPCLPFGQSDIPHKTTINIFCPRCRQVYFPKSVREANIEGAFFGTTFCHLFLLTFPEYVVPRLNQREESLLGGRIYGFRIAKDSIYWSGKRSQNSRTSSESSSYSDVIDNGTAAIRRDTDIK